MESARPKPHAKPVQPAGALDEIYRRVVRIHISLASATDDDRDIRGWSVRQLMDLAHYIESLDMPDQAADDVEHAAHPSTP